MFPLGRATPISVVIDKAQVAVEPSEVLPLHHRERFAARSS